MADFVKVFFPYLVLLSNVVFLLALIAFVFRNSNHLCKKVTLWFGSNALVLGLLVALAAMLGSLSYSEIVGFTPCFLCWWQRIYIYPQVVLFAVALWNKDQKVWKYSLTLAVIALVISIYHVNLQLGGQSFIPCPANGPSCDKILSNDFGYITIPMMALSASLYIIGLSLAHRFKIKNENSHS